MRLVSKIFQFNNEILQCTILASLKGGRCFCNLGKYATVILRM